MSKILADRVREFGIRNELEQRKRRTDIDSLIESWFDVVQLYDVHDTEAKVKASGLFARSIIEIDTCLANVIDAIHDAFNREREKSPWHERQCWVGMPFHRMFMMLEGMCIACLWDI